MFPFESDRIASDDGGPNTEATVEGDASATIDAPTRDAAAAIPDGHAVDLLDVVVNDGASSDLHISDGAWASDSATRVDSVTPVDSRVRDSTLLDSAISDSASAPDSTPSISCAEGWCTIPAMSFTMGSGELDPCGTETVRLVKLSYAYEIAQYEVTQRAYEALTGTNPSDTLCLDCPVTVVTWHDAAAFCNRLTDTLPTTTVHCYTCTADSCEPATQYASNITACPGYRLPTEAEWENAARAGTQTTLYSGSVAEPNCSGSDPAADAIAWYSANSEDTTHPVGQLEPNSWGLFDVAGNVSEWVDDWYEDLTPAPVTDPTGPTTGRWKIYRGGSFSDTAGDLRHALRGWSRPHLSWTNIGFRCARTLTP